MVSDFIDVFFYITFKNLETINFNSLNTETYIKLLLVIMLFSQFIFIV